MSSDSVSVFLKGLNEKDYNLLYLEMLEELQFSVAKLDTAASYQYNHNEYIADVREYLSGYSQEMNEKLTKWRKKSLVPDSIYSPDLDSNYQFISYLMYIRFPNKFDSLVQQNRHYVDSLPAIKREILESF